MEWKSDFFGVEGILKPMQPPAWQTVHSSFLQRNYEVKVILPGGQTIGTGSYLDSRWVPADGDRWELQLINKTGRDIRFKVTWIMLASERVCCFNPVERRKWLKNPD